jgi:superkiller protein 3
MVKQLWIGGLVLLLGGTPGLAPPAIAAIVAQAETNSQHYEPGRRAYRQGNYAEAERIFRDIVRRNPNDAGAHNWLGTALARQGKREEAIVSFRQVLSIDPNNLFAHLVLGQNLAAQGNREEAITIYRQALRLDPNFTEAHTSLGIALIQQGNVEEAIASYRRALAAPENRDGSPSTAHAVAHNNLGHALFRRDSPGDLEAAIAHYDRALAIDPNFTAARDNRRAAQERLDSRRRRR